MLKINIVKALIALTVTVTTYSHAIIIPGRVPIFIPSRPPVSTPRPPAPRPPAPKPLEPTKIAPAVPVVPIIIPHVPSKAASKPR